MSMVEILSEEYANTIEIKKRRTEHEVAFLSETILLEEYLKTKVK